MNFFPFLSLLSALICLVVAEIVYHSNKKEALNKVFALLNLCSAYLSFCIFMCQQADNPETAYMWTRINSFWVFISIFMLHFILIFTEKKKLLKNRITYFIMYTPALFFSIIGVTTDLLSGVPEKNYWGYSSYEVPPDPWLFYIACIWTLIALFLSFILCIHYRIKTTSITKKKQAKYMLFSVVVPFLLSVFEIFFHSFLKIKLPDITPITVSWLNACIGYGIWRYDLFKLNPIKVADNIIAMIPDSLVLVDLDGKIVNINSSLITSFGYREEEIIGKSIIVLFKNNENVQPILHDLLQSEGIINSETEFKTKSGKIIPVLFSSSIIKNKRKQKIGIVFIVRDITERKQAERELLAFNRKLKQSNQELKDFAFIASHDLQEPLRKIIAFGNLLTKGFYDSLEDKGREYLLRIKNAAIRMQRLIDDLLSLSRITIKDKPVKKVDLSIILKEVISDLEVRIEQTKGTVDINSLPVIEADPVHIRQLFQNLIGNALKFHKPGKPPIVKVYTSGQNENGYCRIVVEDNGIGVDEKYHNRIFGVFQRLHKKDEYEGTGIGLAVCKKIAEQYDGSIRVESKKGEGAKFIIRLSVKHKNNIH